MLTVDECRLVDPSLEGLPDDKLLAIRDALYQRAAITIDICHSYLEGSKYPVRVLRKRDDQGKM